MKGVSIFLAEGFEEVEALATADILRRGGVDVKLVSITEDSLVKSSHGVNVKADLTFSEYRQLCSAEVCCEKDFMVFPGGMPGTKNLAACQELMSMMNEHYGAGGSVAAICAAPGLVLSQLKGIEGKNFTCFDSFEGYLEEKGARFTPKPAVTDGRIVSGRSAGHAIAFGLHILEIVKDTETVAAVRHSVMLDTLPE